MQDYAFTRSRIFQWMGILLSLGIIAVGYWYYQSQASTTINKNLSDSLSTGLNLYWPLDDGTSGATPTTAADSSPNGNTGTLTGGPTWTTGQVVNAVDFDGTDDYVTVADTDVLDVVDSRNFTLSGWFNRESNNNDDIIIGKRSGQVSGNTGYNVWIDGTSDTVIFEVCDGTDEYTRASTSTFTGTGWNHFVAVFEDAVGMTIYINGSVNQGSASGTLANIGSLANTVAFAVGAESDAGNPFNGSLDEARMYNRALSADEVAQLYRLTSPTGIDTSLKGYWPFDGDDVSGTTTYDRSGVGSTGTLTNGPTITRGRIGQAISFDGNNDKVALTDNAVFDVGGAGTWCNWFYSTANQSSRGMFSHNVSGGNYVMINGYLTTNSSVLSGYVRVGTTAYTATTPTYSTGYWNNQWHHVCTTFDKTLSSQRLKVYADGVLLGTHDAANGDIDAGNSPMVGNWVFGGGDQTSFQGYIDDMRMYNRALTVAEIKSLYDRGQSDKVNTSATQPQGTGNLDSGLVAYYPLDDGSGSNATDSSTNAITGSLTGSPSWTTGQIGGALDLNGSSQYISVASSTPTDIRNSLTLSVWTNMDTLPGNGQEQTFMYKVVSGGYLFNFRTTQSAGTQRLIFTPGGGGANNLSATITMSTGVWYNFVVTYDINTDLVSFYQNGVLISQVSDTIAGGYSGGTDGTLYLGSTPTPSNYLDGRLDEARVYNRALSNDEVSQLYQINSPTAVDTGLKGYWSFNAQDMSGTTAYDRSGAGNTGTLTNSPTRVLGRVGQALDFDGSNDYVTAGSPTSLDNLSALTAAAWIYPESMGETNKGRIFDKTSTSEPLDGWIINIADNENTYQFGFSVDYSTTNLTRRTVGSSIVPNTWQHVAVTWDGSSTATNVKIYINGSEASYQVTQDASGSRASDASQNLLIGENTSGNRAFDGKIDEARIYNRVLTAAEIKSLYNLGEADKSNSSVSQPQGNGRLDSGLAGYWPLDDGTSGATPTTVADSSPNGNTGTLTSGGPPSPTWTTGQVVNAVDLDGTDDYVTVADPSSGVLDFADSTNFTLSGWFNRDTFTTDDTIIAKSNGQAAGDTGYVVYVDDTNDDLVFDITDGTDEYSRTSTATFTATGWNHFVAVFEDAVGMTIYINGSLNQDAASGTLGNIGSLANAVAFRAGAESDAGNPFDGKLDEVRLYNRALSIDEVGQLYRLSVPTGTDTSLKGYWSFNGQDVSGTTAYDRSGAGNTGTLTNSPTKSIGKVGQALSFDGTDDYVTAADSASLDVGTTNTFSAWFKLNAIPSVNGPIIRKFQSSVEDKVLFVNSDGTVGYYLYDTMGGSSLLSKTVVVANTWYHVAGTYDGTTARIYINGVLDNTKSASGNVADGTGVFDIGRGTNGGPYYFNGQIDEVRAYDRALSATEITALYNQGR